MKVSDRYSVEASALTGWPLCRSRAYCNTNAGESQSRRRADLGGLCLPHVHPEFFKQNNHRVGGRAVSNLKISGFSGWDLGVVEKDCLAGRAGSAGNGLNGISVQQRKAHYGDVQLVAGGSFGSSVAVDRAWATKAAKEHERARKTRKRLATFGGFSLSRSVRSKCPE